MMNAGRSAQYSTVRIGNALVEAYKASYQTAKNRQEDYQRMSLNAHRTLKDHISEDKAKEKLQSFLKRCLLNK